MRKRILLGTMSAAVILLAVGCKGQTRPGAQADAPQKEVDMKLKPNQTASQLRVRAEKELGRESFVTRLTPVLPSHWPDPRGGVVFFAYRREALATGRVRYRVEGPVYRIEFPSLDVPPKVTVMKSIQHLGEEGNWNWPEGFKADLERAEDIMVEVVAGSRSADEMREQLRPYLLWLEGNPSISKDLEKRMGAFVRWLKDTK